MSKRLKNMLAEVDGVMEAADDMRRALLKIRQQSRDQWAVKTADKAIRAADAIALPLLENREGE